MDDKVDHQAERVDDDMALAAHDLLAGVEAPYSAAGSYHSKERIFDIFVVTDRDSYRLDILAGTLTTDSGTRQVASEKDNNAQVVRDFVAAVRENRDPLVTGKSVISAMRLLQQIEDNQAAWRKTRSRFE